MADLLPHEGTGRSLSKRLVAALSVGASLLLAPAAFHSAAAYGSHSTTPHAVAVDLVVEKDMIESEPKMQNCACISDKMAKCSKYCPGGICWLEKPAYAFKPAYMT